VRQSSPAFDKRVAFAKRQRTAALQDADALAAAPFQFMAPMRLQCWRLKLSQVQDSNASSKRDGGFP
jgi:hypothetical protein